VSLVHSPIDGQVLADIPAASAGEIDKALDAARQAQTAWAATPPTRRGRALLGIADLIEAHAEELAAVESRNTGKTLVDTRREVARAAGAFRYYGGYADKVVGETIPVGPEYHTYTVPVPHGVALGIVPWNVPFFFAAKKIAPALAFGNAAVLKPAEETPMSALYLRGLLEQADLPAGLVQILTGGREVGAQLVADPRVDLIVFTGHTMTGKAIARSAADRLVPMVLELGGKSPQLVFEDADLDAAADAISLGIFASAGQMCIAGSRLLVQDSVHDELVARLVRDVERLRVGDPFEDATDVGPQITATQRDKTLGMLERATAESTVLAQSSVPTDARLSGGYFVPPTILADVAPDAEVIREEVFGPVLTVSRFSEEADALRQAADTDFGLAAGVWTSSVGRAHRVAHAVDVGTVWINTYRILSDLVPFGGVRMSGYGRENGSEAARLYTRSKSVWTALESGSPEGYRAAGR
jgi:acyl-CoA reductase-like NAD-dependent aldehyde dehydrogenase